MIRFDLSVALDYTVVSPSDFVFVIQPTNTPYQRVTWERIATEPVLEIAEERNGSPTNRHLRAHVEPGPFRLRYDAIVDLVHHFALPADLREVPIADLPAAVIQYIYPRRYCQSGRNSAISRRATSGSRPSAIGCRNARDSRSAQATPALPPSRLTNAAQACVETSRIS